MTQDNSNDNSNSDSSKRRFSKPYGKKESGPRDGKKVDWKARKRGFTPRPPNPALTADGTLYLYGLHTVRAALDNPARKHVKLMASRNALMRLELEEDGSNAPCPIEMISPRQLDKLVGSDAVHQGAILESKPLEPLPLDDLGDTKLVIVLDQVTDPHNVGALMRSAVAFGAGALITTNRHSPSESGVLAKSASGALEFLSLIEVKNLGNTIETLNAQGFQTIGLDSEGPADMETTISGKKIALVMGAEGKGLRQKTRTLVSDLARLDMPGAIHSLNVSNAGAIALFVAERHLKKLK